MFALEHSKRAYWADIGAYALFVGGMGIALPELAPRSQWMAMAALAAGGAVAWSLAEYLLHRFILHGLEPFRTWHLRHHERPTALISTPTALSASLIAGLVFAPAAFLANAWMAAALTLGVVAGYLAYTVCHHGTHHWRAKRSWFKRQKLWHAMHHRIPRALCYGVTTTLWDRVIGTTPPPPPPRTDERPRPRADVAWEPATNNGLKGASKARA